MIGLEGSSAKRGSCYSGLGKGIEVHGNCASWKNHRLCAQSRRKVNGDDDERCLLNM